MEPYSLMSICGVGISSFLLGLLIAWATNASQQKKHHRGKGMGGQYARADFRGDEMMLGLDHDRSAENYEVRHDDPASGTGQDTGCPDMTDEVLKRLGQDDGGTGTFGEDEFPGENGSPAGNDMPPQNDGITGQPAMDDTTDGAVDDGQATGKTGMTPSLEWTSLGDIPAKDPDVTGMGGDETGEAGPDETNPDGDMQAANSPDKPEDVAGAGEAMDTGMTEDKHVKSVGIGITPDGDAKAAPAHAEKPSAKRTTAKATGTKTRQAASQGRPQAGVNTGRKTAVTARGTARQATPVKARGTGSTVGTVGNDIAVGTATPTQAVTESPQETVVPGIMDDDED